MIASAQYLETAKAEQVERELGSRGYHIERGQHVGNAVYDLVATKGDERIAIEVKARSHLGAEARRDIAPARACLPIRLYGIPIRGGESAPANEH